VKEITSFLERLTVKICKPSGGRNLGWQHQTRHPVSAGSLPDSEL
jgi:hypothetical protein